MDRFLSNPILRRVAKNSAYLFSASGIAVVLSFFQNLLATNLLGVALLGTLGVIVKFTSVINKLGSFRMNELVVKYVGQYQEESAPERAAS
jgi:O-antigen/teichoic acid export membrane protein